MRQTGHDGVADPTAQESLLAYYLQGSLLLEQFSIPLRQSRATDSPPRHQQEQEEERKQDEDDGYNGLVHEGTLGGQRHTSVIPMRNVCTQQGSLCSLDSLVLWHDTTTHDPTEVNPSPPSQSDLWISLFPLLDALFPSGVAHLAKYRANPQRLDIIRPGHFSPRHGDDTRGERLRMTAPGPLVANWSEQQPEQEATTSPFIPLSQTMMWLQVLLPAELSGRVAATFVDSLSALLGAHWDSYLEALEAVAEQLGAEVGGGPRPPELDALTSELVYLRNQRQQQQQQQQHHQEQPSRSFSASASLGWQDPVRMDEEGEQSDTSTSTPGGPSCSHLLPTGS